METFLSKTQAQKLIKQYGSPLLVLKRSKMAESFHTLDELLPRVQLFYAVKSNPHPEIIKTFARLGSSFEVASLAEIEMLIKKKVSPQRIIFANTVKKIQDLKAARKFKIDLSTFDSENELEKIAEHLPRSKVLLRLKVPNIDSMVDLSVKFGAPPEDAVKLLSSAKRKGLVPYGVSFHVGCQCLNPVNYGKALELTAEVFSACKKINMPLSMLDIGGGFPIQYLPGSKVPTIQDIARKINNSLDKLFPDKRIKIIAEPGRFLCGPCANLITSVIGHNVRNGKRWYALDDGLYGTFSGILFDHGKYNFISYDTGKMFASVLAGPSCDSLDIIAEDLYLPKLGIGDMLVTPAIGAYSSAHATRFNGIPLTKSIVIA
ncbi:MAG: type III PLP-dependent enzyme [Candidatus Margulisiibacteriota bacterium]